VLSAIKLDGEFRLIAIEVENIASDRLLASEFHAAETAAAK
jgi:hypothetical protein